MEGWGGSSWEECLGFTQDEDGDETGGFHFRGKKKRTMPSEL